MAVRLWDRDRQRESKMKTLNSRHLTADANISLSWQIVRKWGFVFDEGGWVVGVWWVGGAGLGWVSGCLMARVFHLMAELGG